MLLLLYWYFIQQPLSSTVIHRIYIYQNRISLEDATAFRQTFHTFQAISVGFFPEIRCGECFHWIFVHFHFPFYNFFLLFLVLKFWVRYISLCSGLQCLYSSLAVWFLFWWPLAVFDVWSALQVWVVADFCVSGIMPIRFRAIINFFSPLGIVCLGSIPFSTGWLAIENMSE